MKKFLFFALLLYVAGLLSAQTFTVGDLNYSVISGNNVQVTGHVDGENASGPLSIPSTVTYGGTTYTVTVIKYYAFSYSPGLTSLTLPNTLTSIGYSAFSHCPGLTGNLIIPNSVAEIGEGAFLECSGFTGSLTIPNSLAEIKFSTFDGCSGFNGTLSIPNSVVTIDESAFSRCGFTGGLNIPNSVITIGKNAFYECTGFTGSLDIPNSVTTIGQQAFYKCSGITSISIGNSVISISGSAFKYTGWYNNQPDGFLYKDNCCLGYKGAGPTGSLQIAEGTRLIGGWAFDACHNITSVILPSSLISIGKCAFQNCDGLSGSMDLTNIILLEGYAFVNCSGLTSLILPNVASIGEKAFKNCTGLTSMQTLASVPPVLEDEVFYGVNHSIPVTVPYSTSGAYQNAAGWNEFTNWVEADPVYINAINVLGFTAPVWGAHPDFNLEVPAGAFYTIGEVYWFYGEDLLTPQSVFNGTDNTYFMGVDVVPSIGYAFTSDATVAFNGDASLCNTDMSVLDEEMGIYIAITISYQLSEPEDLSFDFEDGTMQGWTVLDADFDMHYWEVHYGWGHNNSDYYVTSASYDENTVTPLSPDNYLVSPQIMIDSSISFWACAEDANYPEEHFGVAVSVTGGNNPNYFTTIQEWTLTAKSGTWYQYSVDLSAYAGQMGYIAIRHFGCSDQYRLNVDDISINKYDAINENIVNSLSIYPNPSHNILFIEGVEGEMVSVFDATGRLVKQEIYTGSLNVSALKSGIYAVTTGEGTTKFVKE